MRKSSRRRPTRHRDQRDKLVDEYPTRCLVEQSTLTLAALIIGHHMAISAFCQVPSAAGVSWSFGGICKPKFSSCLRTAGLFWASAAAAFNLATTSFGVSLGTQSPDHSVM